jgi:hypothetical protein
MLLAHQPAPTRSTPYASALIDLGYYLSAATMVREETSPPVPELTRRMTLSSCHTDPVRVLAPVLTRMPPNGIPLR